MPGITIIGIGQSLRGDDAAGLEAVRLWREKYPQTASRLRVELSELPGLGLLDLLEGAEMAVLVDALQADAAPGTLIRLGPDELASFGPDARSAHGWGVAETLRLGRSLNPSLAQCRVTLIGIVGEDFAPGAGLSPEVRLALEQAADLIETEIHPLVSLV
jgi:hydrogenase maturation protease